MSWTLTAEFALQALGVMAVLVLLPGGVATVALVRARGADPSRRALPVLSAVGCSLAAVPLLALAAFLLANHVRVLGLGSL